MKYIFLIVISMVKKIFNDDPYMTECEAIVESIMGPEVTLDQTCFFAFSGGQASDSGSINEIPVKEAIASGDNIVYVLESIPSFKEGDKVKVKIDENKRNKLMRLHSAAHIIHFIFAEETGIKKLIGSNIEENKARLDYESSEPISELLPAVEEKANEIFSQDIEIKTFPDSENENKRWWECQEWKCPCGGTHVKSTKEVGKVQLKRKNIGSGKERIEITISA
jgi:Ser-tRNA(Ala) deacylase AlaX